MWAAPCPEGALLALDWALAGRGRLSESLEALAAALLALDLRVVVKKIKNELYEIIANHSGQPIEKVASDCSRDHWLSAIEAKAYGLVDEVLLVNPKKAKKDI